jgi:NAD(P)-dependent dehydrogenase (short-subunit alcohol dehydrogenase family)
MYNKNKVIVITGASSGIGRATALDLAQEGHILVLAARNKQALNELAEECKSIGAKDAISASLDVTYEDEVNNLAKKAIKNYDRIDVWINNAAVTTLGNFEEIPTDVMRRVIDVNVFGYMYGSRAAVKQFKKQGYGTLINVSSIVGITGQPYVVPYSVSKAAIRGLSFSLQQELADYEEIHVCSVCPAVIDTPIFENGANYMGKEVKAPSPVIPAKDVAEAICDLLVVPEHEITVGRMAKVNTLMKTLNPDGFDKQIQKKVYEDHFGESTTPPTNGNLFKFKPENARISGGWMEKTHSKVEPGPLAYVAVVGVAAVATALGAIFMYENDKKNKKELSLNGFNFKDIFQKVKNEIPFLN